MVTAGDNFVVKQRLYSGWLRLIDLYKNTTYIERNTNL